MPPGPHSLADLQEALDLRSPLVGLLPRPKMVPAEPESVQRASERANAQFRLVAKGKSRAASIKTVVIYGVLSIYVYTCVFLYIDVHTYIYIYMYIHMYTYKRVHI